MYTSNNGDKSKKNTRTKLTDMGVVVIEDEINSTNSKGGNTESERSNERNEKQSLLNEDDASLDVTSVDRGEKRSRFKRVMIAGSVTTFLLFVLLGFGYLWLSNNQSETDAYKVKAPAVASNKADEQTRGITAEEISEELYQFKLICA